MSSRSGTPHAAGEPNASAPTRRSSVSSRGATPHSVASTAGLNAPATIQEDAPSPVAIPPVPGIEEKDHIEALLSIAEKEVKATLADITSEEILTKFRNEYEKLFRSLTRSVHTGLRSFDQYAQLHHTFHDNAHNSKMINESTSQDEQTIRNLKTQIKRANEYLESARTKEEKSKDEVRSLKMEINDLKTTMQKGVGLSATQERNINELIKLKEETVKELEMEMDRINMLRSRISEINESTRGLDTERRALEGEISILKARYTERKSDVDSELKNKESLETDLKEMRAMVSTKIAEVKQKQENVARANEDIAHLQNHVKNQRQVLEKAQREHENVIKKADKYREECDQQISITTGLANENSRILSDLQHKEADLSRATDELMKNTKILDGLQKKIRMLETKKNEAETLTHRLKEDSNEVFKSIELVKGDIEKSKKNMEDLAREKSILLQSSKKLSTETERDHRMLELLQPTRVNLEQDKTNCIALLQSKLHRYQNLENEKQEYLDKLGGLQVQMQEAQILIKQRELDIYKHKKSVVDVETKLKYQQNLYETVQSERNTHAKNLVDSQHEIAEMRRQLKIMNFQISGLKEEYQIKQDSIAREISDHEKLDKEIASIEDEIKNLKQQNELAQAYIRTQVTEENKLGQYLKEAEGEHQKQEHALSLVVSERDRLSSQLIKQDGELIEVYDVIKANQYGLLRNQKHYIHKKRQVLTLEAEIRKIRTDQRLLSLSTRDYGILKQAVHQLKAELLEDQCHIKVLSNEVKNPINIHRWRKLEGTDPGQLETVQLIHSLQKALIAKTTEDQLREEDIHSQEVTYMQLKEVQKRQVGPELLEQLNSMEKAVKEKRAQHKHMNAELNLHQAKIKEYKYALSGLERQIKELRQLYFEKKKGEPYEPPRTEAKTVHLPDVGSGKHAKFSPNLTGDEQSTSEDIATAPSLPPISDDSRILELAPHDTAQPPAREEQKQEDSSSVPLLPPIGATSLVRAVEADEQLMHPPEVKEGDRAEDSLIASVSGPNQEAEIEMPPPSDPPTSSAEPLADDQLHEKDEEGSEPLTQNSNSPQEETHFNQVSNHPSGEELQIEPESEKMTSETNLIASTPEHMSAEIGPEEEEAGQPLPETVGSLPNSSDDIEAEKSISHHGSTSNIEMQASSLHPSTENIPKEENNEQSSTEEEQESTSFHDNNEELMSKGKQEEAESIVDNEGAFNNEISEENQPEVNAQEVKEPDDTQGEESLEPNLESHHPSTEALDKVNLDTVDNANLPSVDTSEPERPGPQI
jgi:chromosome segregation ATPase